MTSKLLEPFFLDTAEGGLFALYQAPANATRCVLFVPPFAEEMNKSRRQFTETSQALNDRGYATLIVDLFGTGDSAGEFSDGTWARWIENISSTFSWASDQSVPVDSVIATRLGCVLAAEVLSRGDCRVQKSVFWQPVANGKQYMTQFLRLRVAAAMMEGDGKEGVEELKQRLADGETLEVAGYELSPQLWADIESNDLSRHLNKNIGGLLIAEIGRARDGGLSPAGRRIQQAANQLDVEVEGVRLAGEPFWSATEIVVNEELRQATVDFIVADAPA